jgi:hypothetical protein
MGTKPQFSRSGQTSPLGKFTADFPKFKGPEETKEILEREARLASMTLAEFIRNLCMVRAHGEKTIRSLYDKRMDVVVRNGEEKG